MTVASHQRGREAGRRSKSAFESTFTVTGRGEFPHDMLRYDSCWPYSISDAARMAGTERRTIKLQTGQLNSPTVARWDSFGWKVLP